MTTANPLISVKNLTTSFVTDDGEITAVDGISFDVEPGKTLCIVGESGCGKSVTALSIMRLIPGANGRIHDTSSINLHGTELLKLDREDMRKYRGNEIGMIFQEPMTALDPVYTVGEQIAEAFKIHRGMSKKEGIKAAVEMLRKVKIPAPERRVHEYPHQMSGGMKQRVMIAMALACEPKLLIADEPSTALDVTVQAQILKLMRELQEKLNTAIIFITHDLGVVAEIADDVLVMYAGQVIEKGSVYQIFENPQHPYTRGLLQSIPKFDSEPKSKLYTIQGIVPSLAELPIGCRFQERCPFVQDTCRATKPELRKPEGSDHEVACYFPQSGEL